MPCPFNFSRRSFLSGLAASAAVGAAPRAGAAPTSLPLESTDSLDRPGALDFHGEHQQGIINSPQKYSEIVALDVQVKTKARLDKILRTLSERARILTAGGTPAPDGIAFPAMDSG